MTVRNLITIVLSSLLLVSCEHQTRYSEFQSVPLNGWNADSVLVYDIDAAKVDGKNDIILCIRHSEAYPYQNMWLFCSLALPDSTVALWVDTLEFYLADDRGRWLGNGGLKLYEMPVLFAQHYQFPDSGMCRFTIRHGMREEQLRGVSDIGLIIRNGEE